MTDRNANRPGYKKTRVGWIPEEWEVKRFSEVAKVNPRKPQEISDDMIVGFVPMANVSESGELIKFDEVHCEEVKSGYTFFGDGDILVAKITPSFENGKGCLVNGLPNGVGFGSTEFHVLRSKKINAQFLFYHTKSYPFRVKGGLNMTGTAGQKRVPTDYLKNYRIPVPSDTEQREIVEILSTWDRAIEQTRKLIDAKQRLKRGLMQQLLTGRLRFPGFGPPAREKGELPAGWRKYEFSELTRVSNEKFHPQENEDDMRCIELEHIEQGTGRIIGWVDSSDQSSTKNKFAPSDVLFGKLRPYLRKFAFMDFDGVCSSEIWVLQAKSIVLPKYLYLLIQTDRFMSAVTQTTGTKMPRADWDVVSRQVFFIPDMDEQKKIVGMIASIDAGEKILAKRINYLLTSKKGLLQKLLSGEIRTC